MLFLYSTDSTVHCRQCLWITRQPAQFLSVQFERRSNRFLWERAVSPTAQHHDAQPSLRSEPTAASSAGCRSLRHWHHFPAVQWIRTRPDGSSPKWIRGSVRASASDRTGVWRWSVYAPAVSPPRYPVPQSTAELQCEQLFFLDASDRLHGFARLFHNLLSATEPHRVAVSC